MAILVTGGAGFVGVNIVERLLNDGEVVVVYDRKPFPVDVSKTAGRNHERLHRVIGDVTDEVRLKAVCKQHDVHEVVHAAVITSDMRREGAEPGRILDVNVRGTINAMTAAREYGCRRFVYVGSGQAYGKTHDEGQTLHEEVSPSRPSDIYGISKFAGEQCVLRLGELWPLDVICVRLGSVLGPWEGDTGVRDMLSPYFQVAMRALRGEAAVLPAHEVRRDWIYSRDAADGIVRALRAVSPAHRVYHLSSGLDWRGTFANWCSLLQQRYSAFSWRVASRDDQPNVSFLLLRDRAPMDVSRIARDFGFKARFGPAEAYRDYVEWIVEHKGYLSAQANGAT